MNKILIVEDDYWISNWLKLYLENTGFCTEIEKTWKDVVEKILTNNYDLVILDINLPIKDWITICKEVRVSNNTPIIMLTARNSELDKIAWLELWADDYISKPFSPRELLARINTILRRINSKETNWNLLKFKDIEIDLDKCIVKNNNIEINFTKNEFDILKKLIEEDWKIVDRDTLMKDIIWYENYAFDRTIDTHIKNIRKKIQNKDLILTIRWVWYRINK